MKESADASLKYGRVLLKLSGEAFGTNGKSGIDILRTMEIARQIKQAVDHGVELAIVVGGGNILRGAQFTAAGGVIKEATADHMGMLGTVMNGLALQDALESLDCDVALLSAIPMLTVAEQYILRRALTHLQKRRILILAAGTGNPGVTTDTAAALKACDLNCDVLMKATRVDGVYSDDPEKNPHAVRYETLTYTQVVQQGLRVMDIPAIDRCARKNLPIIVFDFGPEGALEKAILGQSVGTLIHDD